MMHRVCVILGFHPNPCGKEFSMAHAPQFLRLVNEAKKKVKETNVSDVKRRIEAGEKFLLVDVREDNEWANAIFPGGSSGQGHHRARYRATRAGYQCQNSSFTAAEAFAPRWSRTTCRKWATPTSNPWTAAGKPG